MVDRKRLERAIETIIAQDNAAEKPSRGREFVLDCLMELNSYKIAEELGILVRTLMPCTDTSQRRRHNG